MIAFPVRYEELVEQPNIVQKNVEWFFKIDSRILFSDYHLYMKAKGITDEHTELAQEREGEGFEGYKLKPITDSYVGRGEEVDDPLFNLTLGVLGYK